MASFETRSPDRLSYSDALGRLLAAVPPLRAQYVSILEAEGRASAEEVRSTLTLPPSLTSHMDGYALRSDELSRVRAGTTIGGVQIDGDSNAFRVIGKSFPGEPWTAPLDPGTAVRVMTGAWLPPEADTVVPVEETDREAGNDGVVRIRIAALPPAPSPLEGRFLRPVGEEAREGEILASPGDTLDYRLLAHLAAAGVEGLQAHPLPRVALLMTGSELVPAGDRAALAAGVRRADLLSPALGSLVRRAGGIVSNSVRASDDRESLRRGFLAAAGDADLLITTGGASMGEADLVKEVLLELGGSIDFWGIRMRPGSPVSVGQLPRSDRPPLPVLSLPGNPVSAIVTFTLLGIPALRTLGGHTRTCQRTVAGRVRTPLPGPVHLTRFPRVRLMPEGGGEWGVHMSGEDGSGVIRGIAGGDGVALLPEGEASPGLGEFVEVILFPGTEWVELRL